MKIKWEIFKYLSKKYADKRFVVFIIANKIDIMINENKSIKKIWKREVLEWVKNHYHKFKESAVCSFIPMKIW